MQFDPYEVKDAVKLTSIDDLEADEVFIKASKLALDVQGLFSFVAECPRWRDLYDQIQRSSASVLANFSEGWGKIRGHCSSAWLIARGECSETLANLTIAPKNFRDLKPQCKEVYKLLDAKILGLVERHERPAWKN